MAAIPTGRTDTYGELAKRLKIAPRAVGQACGANPYPLVVPCHRVVAAGGGLGGFNRQGGGFQLDVKRWLLRQEGISEADAVICLTNDDKLNLLVALLAKRLGAKKTFVRVGRNEYASIMQQVGVDVVLSPQILTASVILRFIRQGDLVSLMLFEGAKAEAMELIVADGAKIIGKPLHKAHFPPQSLIGMVVRNGKTMIANGNTILQVGDRAIIFTLPGKSDEITSLFQGNG